VVTGQTEPVAAWVFAGRDSFENWAVQRSRLAWIDPLEALGKREKVMRRVPLGVFFLELRGTERIGGGNPAPGIWAVETEGTDTKGDGLRCGQRLGESGDREGEKG